MDEQNKTPINETESVSEQPAVSEEERLLAEAEALANPKLKKAKKEKQPRPKKLKNELLWKRGGYSVAITALLLAGVIVLNVLLGLLADRTHLAFDFSTDKANTISEENMEYIKAVKDAITVTVCASEADYASNMSSVQSSYSVSGSYSEYYEQTLTLLKKYAEYNDKITVRFVDMYDDPAFDAIKQQYANESLTYGDIIISDGKEEDERYKIIGYNDIYELTEDSSNSYYSYFGISSYAVTGNKVETAVTSGIVYVQGSDTKKAVLLTGHSDQTLIADYVSAYTELLEDNNFEVETVTDNPVTALPDGTDTVVIMAPSMDFTENEISTLVNFLDNDGKLGRGLLYFGSAVCPQLPNLYALLAEWNIQIGEGKLYETDANYQSAGDGYTFSSYYYYQYPLMSSNNQPITVSESTDETLQTAALGATSTGVVVAPIGADRNWNDYTESDMDSFATIAASMRTSTDDNGEDITGMVAAFASMDFITSVYAEQDGVYNKDLTLWTTEQATQAEDTGISFVSKSISDDTFSAEVSGATASAMLIIFVLLLPLCTLVIGIVIYVKRRNA